MPSDRVNHVSAELFLFNLGAPSNLLGHKFLCDALTYVSDHPEAIYNVTGSLYPAVAAMNDSTASRVERNIRTAIKAIFEHGDSMFLGKVFAKHLHSRSAYPSNSVFISRASEAMRIYDYLDQPSDPDPTSA